MVVVQVVQSLRKSCGHQANPASPIEKKVTNSNQVASCKYELLAWCLNGNPPSELVWQCVSQSFQGFCNFEPWLHGHKLSCLWSIYFSFLLFPMTETVPFVFCNSVGGGSEILGCPFWP